MSSPAESALPSWALMLAGGLLASWLAPAREPQVQPPEVRSPGLAHASARELRRVPGLGEKRAMDLVEARWEHADGDPPLFLNAVAGMGPVSIEGVAAWLATRAEPQDPAEP